MAEIFRSIVEPLQTSAAVKSVFGEAISAQGKTIIPVARIAYGFGGGSGHAVSEEKGHGEGGGGGVAAIPVGVFEITDVDTRFVPLHSKRKMALAGLAGLVTGMFWAWTARHRIS